MRKIATIMIGLTFLLLMSGLSGCTRRAVTMTSWWDDYVYVGYWEGKCAGGFCTKGKPMVKRCNVNADNTVTCVEEEQLSTLLAE